MSPTSSSSTLTGCQAIIDAADACVRQIVWRHSCRHAARFALDVLPTLTWRSDQIKHLRQTILNLAMRGKLVPQNPTDEQASELLTRLKKAQVAAYSREDLRARPPIVKLTREDLTFDFPASWELASFDEVFVIVSGVTKGQRIPANEAIEVPYARVANVQRGHLDLAVV